MSETPEALRLADALERGTYLLSRERDATAAELRRLYAECEALRADAERYHYLLKHARRIDICGFSLTETSMFQLSARIDAARAALKEVK